MTTPSNSIVRRLYFLFIRCLTWPIRRWRAVGLVLVGAILLAAIAYTIVDQALLRRLEAQRKQIRDSEGAKEYIDLLRNRVDDAQNAAIPYRHANAMLRRLHWNDRKNARTLLEKLSRGPACSCEDGLTEGQTAAVLSEEKWNEFGKYVDGSRPSLVLIEEGVGLKACCFYGDIEGSGMVSVPDYYDTSLMESLVCEVACRAIWESHQGDVDGALR